MPFRYLIRKQKQQGENMKYEQKAELQDSNKARMYEEKKKQDKLKTYTIYGIQGHNYKAEVKASSKEQAMQLAKDKHEDYDWKNTDYIDDWNYEIGEVSDE